MSLSNITTLGQQMLPVALMCKQALPAQTAVLYQDLSYGRVHMVLAWLCAEGVSVNMLYVSQELLQTCGRSHSLEDVYAAIEAVKAADFPSWSLDLISGLPKLTLEVWQHSLNEAITADPDHISIYDLQVG